jgi:hypothetical protein
MLREKKAAKPPRCEASGAWQRSCQGILRPGRRIPASPEVDAFGCENPLPHCGRGDVISVLYPE